jgi:hypothetical protein
VTPVKLVHILLDQVCCRHFENYLKMSVDILKNNAVDILKKIRKNSKKFKSINLDDNLDIDNSYCLQNN